jgi:hypothetical protein
VKELPDEPYSYERLAALSWAQIKQLRERSGRVNKHTRIPALVPQERGPAVPLS